MCLECDTDNIATANEADSLPSLDLAEDNRNNSSCGQWSITGLRSKDAPEEWTHLRVYCKKWSCPVCGPKKAARLKKAIIANATARKLNKLMTLTLDPKKCAAEDSIPHIKECWNKLRTYLKREYGKTASFITVLEFQKNGYAHLHILVDRYVDQKWLSESWEALGGGKIVHIRYVDIHRVTHYLAKYLTKGMFLEHYGKNRRYTTSRGLTLFPKKAKNPNSEWHVLRLGLDYLKQVAGSQAVQIEHDREGNIRCFMTGYSLLQDCVYLYDFVLPIRRRKKRDGTS